MTNYNIKKILLCIVFVYVIYRITYIEQPVLVEKMVVPKNDISILVEKHDMSKNNMYIHNDTNYADKISKQYINYDKPVEKTNTKCNIKTCGSTDLHPVLKAEFNMREAAKQCLLLEDHINNKKKRCIDCIKKHFLMIDGLLEEAVSLEADNKQRDYYRDLYVQWVDIEKRYVINSSMPYNMDEISKLIRIFRKPLANKYFDYVSEY